MRLMLWVISLLWLWNGETPPEVMTNTHTWFLFRNTPKSWLQLPVTCMEFPGLQWWCHKDETEFRVECLELWRTQTWLWAEDGQHTNTHACVHTHTHEGLTDCCWVTGAHADTHTHWERKKVSKQKCVDDTSHQSQQAILIKHLRVGVLI